MLCFTLCWFAAFIPKFHAGAALQSECSDQLETTTAATADHNPDCDTPPDELSLDVNSLARANSSTADTVAAWETANTSHEQTATAVAADFKAHCDTAGDLDVNTLAKVSCESRISQLDCTA